MRKHSMPSPRAFERPNGLQWEISPAALERWTPDLQAAAVEDNTISILDPIGQDPWTGEGVTAKRIAAALRAIGAKKDVTVFLNSPGGDLFEGMAIYNLLREHQGDVQVKILGLAASAASVIAMAGDEILIARAGFLMIHDTWVFAMGNRNDLRLIADTLEPFDHAMADIYAARSGQDAKATLKMMDAETWIAGSAAVEQGFADDLLPADQVKKDKNARTDHVAAYLLDMALAKAGMPRSQRRELLQDYKAGTPRAAGAGTPRAAEVDTRAAAEAADYSDFLNSITEKKS
ncbi:MAG: head maturation protease, ClpP-related [Betaproteobacteria bacterium]